ncbi:MAG: haloperoxidase, partial [Saprospiraceae bacterium]|nr:haloperoxidase [Saprospiraceae bacterium]
MKQIIFIFIALGMLTSSQLQGQSDSDYPTGAENMAYKWGKLSLDATAYDTDRFKPRPTITSRYLGLIWVSVFDAWSRYDKKAIPVYLKEARRPGSEHTLANKQKAISYAAYRTMCNYYYTDSLIFRDFMIELGYDPDNWSLDPTTPEGIGNLAAKTIIEARIGDGSNMYGEESRENNEPYHDYTNYQPVNSVDENKDLNKWQPKYFSDGKGGKYAPSCLTPFWDKVQPVALKSGDQFRP